MQVWFDYITIILLQTAHELSPSQEVGSKINCKVVFKAFKTRNFLKIAVTPTPFSIINP